MLVVSTVMVTLLALLLGYKKSPYRPLPARRGLVLFPKYRCEIILPRQALLVDDLRNGLGQFLNAHGFIATANTGFPIEFRKGLFWHDAATQLSGLRLRFIEMSGAGYRCSVTMEACWLVPFDRGHLAGVLQQIRAELQHASQPQWQEGAVDEQKAHILLRDAVSGAELARLAGEGGVSVQFFTTEPSLLLQVRRELDFYFGEKQESDPWAYAVYHCGTAANIYSPVRWSYLDARRRDAD